MGRNQDIAQTNQLYYYPINIPANLRSENRSKWTQHTNQPTNQLTNKPINQATTLPINEPTNQNYVNDSKSTLPTNLPSSLQILLLVFDLGLTDSTHRLTEENAVHLKDPFISYHYLLPVTAILEKDCSGTGWRPFFFQLTSNEQEIDSSWTNWLREWWNKKESNTEYLWRIHLK